MENDKNCSPRLTIALTRDWGSFLATFGIPIMGSIAFAVYLLAEIVSGRISDSTISDISLFLLMIPLSGLVFMPAVLWWYYVIRRTFQTGKVLEAKIKKVDRKFIGIIGVTYAYEEEGKEIERIADFVNTKKVRSILSLPQITVVVDKKRNISFIREIFDSNNQGQAEA